MKLFGTDGVRGIAGKDLTTDLAMRLGRAAAHALEADKHHFVVARDTRLSGEELGGALSEGLMSAGADVTDCGVLPTPAVSYLVGQLGATGGAMVSASHNPVEFNGIKFFDKTGYKLSESQESEIERKLDVSSPAIRGTLQSENLNDLYIEHCLQSLEGTSLSGLKVVVDCAFGAAYYTTPQTLRRAGAEVVEVNCVADGSRINVDCGSASPENLSELVRSAGAHLGLAHDGDADRVIGVDEQARVVDGDALIAALAIAARDEGRLLNNVVVSTVMANLGFRLALQKENIALIETGVGDRLVLEAMLQHGASLGGEQSGHIILLDHARTGDGLIAGLRLMSLMKLSGRKLSDITSIVQRYPQVLLNVAVEGKARPHDTPAVRSLIDAVTAELGSDGRVVVRSSGTEPVIRIMVEAADEKIARSVAERISTAVQENGR